MAGIGDLAIVKLVGSILKKGKDKAAVFMEHKEPQTYEEYKQSWEEDDKKSTKTDKEQVEPKSDDSPKKETKAEATTTKKPASTKAKTTTAKKTTTEAKTKPVATKKSTTTKKPASDKTKVATAKKPATKKEPTGTKREAKIKLYTEDVKKHYGSVDRNFLDTVVKNLGPSIYRKDAESVSCTDPKELDTVRKNFCIKKLGFDKSESEMLDIEIKKVCELMKPSKIKYRATFYYILAKNLKKESALN